MTWFLVGVAALYAIAVLWHPSWELHNALSAAVITSLDAILALGVVASTGAAESPAVAILFLVVVAAATRLSFLNTLGVALAVGAVHLTLALLIDAELVAPGVRLQAGVWWAVYLLFTGVLVASLALLTEYAERARSIAEADATAEHIVAEEERDLRARLLRSYEAQETGLRVILHEFRTPITSLHALTRELGTGDAARARGDDATVHLVAAHADHLSAMMDALADVAASRRATFNPSGYRTVDLADLLDAARDAAGLPAGGCRVTVDPPDARCRLEAQLARRVLTNLLENADRHGDGSPVDVTASAGARVLDVRIADRGPGIPAAHVPKLTGKFAAIGEQRGTAGLGLWIVDQIVASLGGDLDFSPRAGGGLLVRVTLPLSGNG